MESDDVPRSWFARLEILQASKGEDPLYEVLSKDGVSNVSSIESDSLAEETTGDSDTNPIVGLFRDVAHRAIRAASRLAIKRKMGEWKGSRSHQYSRPRRPLGRK